jgi:Ca-activated chloride channel family protein
MTFLWPEMLWLLLVAPLLVAAYLWLLRRRKKNALRFASVGLMKVALGPAHRLRRHLPPLFFLLVLVASIIAIARPSAVVTLPSQQQTIMLAMDVSLSMGAKDVDPNRLTAAQLAAKSFVEEYPADTRIGIVAFGATASLVQTPTQNREDLLAAIDRFQLQRGTATGSALYVALATLFPDAGIDLESLVFKGGLQRYATPGPRQDPKPAAEKKEFKPVQPGSYTSAAIILLSDGRRTTGPDPLDAAKMAAERGVKVYTVGFGTKEGAAIGFEGWSVYVRLDRKR